MYTLPLTQSAKPKRGLLFHVFFFRGKKSQLVLVVVEWNQRVGAVSPLV
jgi:hypothetical protein